MIRFQLLEIIFCDKSSKKWNEPQMPNWQTHTILRILQNILRFWREISFGSHSLEE